MWGKKLTPLDIGVLNNLLPRLDALEYPVLKLNLLVEALDSAVDFGASRVTLRGPCGALKSIFFFFFFFFFFGVDSRDETRPKRMHLL